MDCISKINMENEEIQGKHLIFSLCGTDYGVEIGYVTEIIAIQPITRVPRIPTHLKGIINIRGTILPVIDLRLRFMCEAAEYNERTCIIALNVNDTSVGLIVDSVKDVIQFSGEDMLPPPAVGSSDQNRFLKAIGKYQDDVKQLVNIYKIVGMEG